ncbi:unnamed protein product [Allacma fusca]|uniref:Uncharacterized protein n=1 Tax=Allacma fusca TaxID=39272 RepID=A0A8J2KNM4_9HEXA|nr:unnamed protein product [Allacma fusca]
MGSFSKKSDAGESEINFMYNCYDYIKQQGIPGEYGDPNFETMLEAKEKYLRYGQRCRKTEEEGGEDEDEEEDSCDDPCLCPDKNRRYTLPPSPEPSDHTFENLNATRRGLCGQIYPKNLGHVLTEDILLEILIRNPQGDYEMILPGNQIYPGFLARRISDEDIPVIVNVLLEIRGITKINLCYNEITDTGIQLLAPAILECGNVVDIDLMHNNLTARGILALVKVLAGRGPLRSLRLTGMKIGEEGMRALTCLVLSGRVPLDLDIGECDVNIEGFQTLCSALYAIENDIDYPDFILLKNNLPMDLVALKNMKADFNEEVSQTVRLNRKTSLPEFVRVKDDPFAEKLMPGQRGGGDAWGLEPEVFETFSATILQGLFDLRHRFSEDDVEKQELDNAFLNPPQVLPGDKHLPEVDKIIDNYKKIRDGEMLNGDDDDEESVFITRSLYCLDDTEEVSVLEPLIDYSDEYDHDSFMDINDHSADNPSDLYTAQAAATFVVKEAVQTAAKNTATSSFSDGTDITQLLLMTVLNTIESISQGLNLTEEDCNRILEDAMEKVCEFLFPKLALKCQVTKDDIRCFFKVLLNASKGTFKQLLENPFITQALVDHGTIACREADQQRQGRRLKSRGGAMSESQIRTIAASFLQGVIKESARIVGVASPFGLEEDLTSDLAATELKIDETLNSLFDTAGSLASDIKARANQIDEVNQEYGDAADGFVFDLFENVHKLVCETEMKDGDDEDDTSKGPQTYKHVSRPVRLVLNRPLFGPSSDILAAKIGDYLASNTSVKALHMQKWELAEDGMAALMEPILSRNTTLVLMDLACNYLAADGIKLLSIYMTQNKNLRHLILHHNGIKDAGLAHLNEHLMESSLVSLDIAHNDITNKQLNPLLTILPLTQIRALFLWGNKFGPETWARMKSLYDQGILNAGSTDIILQQADQERMVVKNMQIRDTNEYYEVPAEADVGLRLPPSYVDQPHKQPRRLGTTNASVIF